MGLKNTRHFFIQSEVKLKPMATHSHSFSCASRQLVVITSFVWIKAVSFEFREMTGFELFAKTSRHFSSNPNQYQSLLLAHIFPRFAPWAACSYFELLLVCCVVYNYFGFDFKTLIWKRPLYLYFFLPFEGKLQHEYKHCNSLFGKILIFQSLSLIITM